MPVVRTLLTGLTLFLLASEMPNRSSMAGKGARTGQVLTVEAPAPRVGWP